MRTRVDKINVHWRLHTCMKFENSWKLIYIAIYVCIYTIYIYTNIKAKALPYISEAFNGKHKNIKLQYMDIP